MTKKSIKILSAEPDTFLEYLRKIWEYKSLILSFAVKDIKSKYAQTFLGISWTLLQPLTGVIIFSLFFGFVLNIREPKFSYPVFALIGFSSWNLWSFIFLQGSHSVFEQRNLISKVYFPKIVLPLSKVITGSFDFLISSILLIFLILLFQVEVSWRVVLLPFFFILQIVFAVSCALILAVISIKKRDFFHIIPYILNFGIWLTPVFYAIQVFPEKWRFIFNYNPIALCIEGYRWCIFDRYVLDLKLFYSLPIILIIVFIAIVLIKKNEDKFVEII